MGLEAGLCIQSQDKTVYRRRMNDEKNECQRSEEIRRFGATLFAIVLIVCTSAMLYLQPTPMMP